ncbi:uncharacterized protein LOC142767580 [Rhipicephalus microplus]|uniref:uncharacterized protein LOC142767580 n=1 Tax=Rhipicephalus microplus TaxID=6941 RepID=UPI003F6CD4D7
MTTRQQKVPSRCHRCISATMTCTLFLCVVLWSCLTPVYTHTTCCPQERLDGDVEDFLRKNQRLRLVGMSDVDLGSPARCMHAEFKLGSTDVAEADLFYEEADQTNGGSWTSKTATLKLTKELNGQHVDIIVKGSPRLTFEFFYAKNKCLIMGTSLPPTGEKTNCLIWSTQTEKECVSIAEQFCVKPRQFTSSLQECPRW